MFVVTADDLDAVLQDFGIREKCAAFSELQRYDYEKHDPPSKEVRLIVKAELSSGRVLVVRFKNEKDAPLEVIEAQSRFAVLLADNGIQTPRVYASHGKYARQYHINGYDVIATAEDFVTGELKAVDAAAAQETGMLLAKMHNIAEGADAHIASEVLFDPLQRNDLFSFEDFAAYKDRLAAIDEVLYNSIQREHTKLLNRVKAFEKKPRYAVQGDISNCNLYRTPSGALGVFDFNRGGDNNLYFDAVMQAIFEARLMDYPEELAGRQENVILSAFLQGYHQERPFTREQKEMFPFLYALVSAFWQSEITWGSHSLAKALEANDPAAARQWMQNALQRALYLPPMPVKY